MLDLETGARKIISLNRQGVGGISWSPDSQWIAFQQNAVNSYAQIYLYGLVNGEATSVTSDRVNSWSPAWGARGDWLYFVSDRSLQSLVGSPWGARQPEPYFDKSEKIYQIALRPDVRSPFRPKDELIKPDEIKNGEAQAEEKDGTTEKPEVEKLAIDLAGIQRRVRELPAKRGNIYNLSANDGFLFWQERDSGPDAKSHLKVMQITNEKPESKTLIENVTFYDLSDDGKKILVRVEKDLYVIDAQKDAPPKLVDHKLDLGNWNFAINVREDWRQIFIDAWRMERDYFYDPGMHGVDWDAVKDRYLPLVDRVTTRLELNELIGRAVGELSVLHTATYGGDTRRGKDSVQVASLGARLRRDMNAGGYVVDYIYLSDPDYPDELSPMSDPDVDVGQGDVITTINGIDTLSVPDIGVLLRNQGGKQVRLGLRRQDRGAGEAIVSPTTNEAQLRYRDWKLNRRLLVEEQGGGRIGYVHLSAMGSANLTEWYRQFYPVFDREGLIIDVRHNRGGNIDSLILEKLLRKAWFYWKSRVGEPYWNMQYAFRGHMVVLCDQNTASDGEAFAEGFRRLGLGEVIGTRTWGGEIWLSYNNRLTDQGIASVPQSGVYSEKGEWLIEQHGVEPDIEIDNLPHATYMGEDAQLDKAIDVLLTKIKRDPRLVPEAPPYPNHKFNYRDGVE